MTQGDRLLRERDRARTIARELLLAFEGALMLCPDDERIRLERQLGAGFRMEILSWPE